MTPQKKVYYSTTSTVVRGYPAPASREFAGSKRIWPECGLKSWLVGGKPGFIGGTAGTPSTKQLKLPEATARAIAFSP